MNCKPGDLAYIVDHEVSENNGAFVHVLRRAPDLEEGYLAWECKLISKVLCWRFPGPSSGVMEWAYPGELVDWADFELRPIRPQSDYAVDEMVLIAGKPHDQNVCPKETA